MKRWNELVKIALLGTEKMPLPEAVLPDPIRVKLATRSDGDREARFYTAAAMTQVYEQAGQLPERHALPVLPPAPAEQQAFCPPAYLPILRKLLAYPAPRPELLEICFGKLIRNGLVLPFEFVVATLRLGTLPAYKPLQDLIRRVVGARGQWLQQFNPAWAYLTPKDPALTWQEGTAAERRQFLFLLRQTDPRQAFIYLKDCWETESGRDRQQLLKIFRLHPQPGELDFVQDVFTAADQAKAGKVQQQELKKTAVEILLLQPESELYQRVVAGLKKYAAVQKSMMGLRSKKALRLPAEPDAFFNEALMADQLGFEKTSAVPGVSEPLFWFCELTRSLHPAAWETLLGEPWEEIIQVFATMTAADQQSAKLEPLSNLAQALARTKYSKGALAFLKQLPADNANYFMLEFLFESLSNAEIEQYALQRRPGQLSPQFCENLLRPGWAWSKALSVAVLNSLLEDNNNGFHYREIEKMLRAGAHLHLGTIDLLYEEARKDVRDWQRQTLRKQLILPLLQILETRRDIESI